ncbi:YciI family protein [Paenibacillus thermotolerans]|uniref:YciI family protein n=1 Tax=Paenibacillus thermotolerans TaxID=3027807 RepID=UPI002367EA1F|nr:MULTISPECIES: YciI family protein [unclassified Paenibacillus]
MSGKKYYVVFLPMLDEQKSAEYRPAHLDYLAKLRDEGHIFSYGRFLDGWGGMVIYIADREEQVKDWVLNDPYIVHNARRYEIREWAMTKGNLEG